MTLAPTEPAVRRHPTTSAFILAPYVPFGIKVEWYDSEGQGPYRMELEMVSRERPYVVGYKQLLDTFENLLPVLRPFATIATLGPPDNPLAVQVAKLLVNEHPSVYLTYQVTPEPDGATVEVLGRDRNEKPVRFCKVFLADGNFQIQGPQGGAWSLHNVLQVYELLREHHLALGLRPDQYAAL